MSVCPRCGSVFDCGMAECTPAPCWCTRLPPLAPNPSTTEASACYCPACLRLLSGAIPDHATEPPAEHDVRRRN